MAAEAAASEARRAVHLHADGLVSDQELERAKAAAGTARAQAEELTLAEERTRAEWQRDSSDRRAALRSLEREIVELRGLIDSSTATVERTRETLRRQSVRAPVAGTVVEVTRLGRGAVVKAGEPLVTLIPEARLQAVARFDASAALGRIRPGQPAEIRLDGFPWTEFGVLRARVRTVAGELRDGKVVVVLDLLPQANRRIPLRHGLPGSVAVRVEESSPAGVLFRSFGWLVSPGFNGS